jgi:hypothetical protein
MLVRGIYYEAWRPSGKPEKIRSCEEFLYPIAAKLAQAPIKPEAAVRAVFQGLKNHIAPGEVLHVLTNCRRASRVVEPVAGLGACVSRSHTAWRRDWRKFSSNGDP